MITQDGSGQVADFQDFATKRFKHEFPFTNRSGRYGDHYGANYDAASASTTGYLPLLIHDDVLGAGTGFFANIATETVDISDGIGRILAAARAIATETTTISEASLTRLRAVTSAPAAETVTISEASLTRMLAAQRAPALESVPISDSVQRSPLLDRTINEQPVAISDSVSRQIVVTRPTATEIVAISDGVARMLAASRSIATETVVILGPPEFNPAEFNPDEFNAVGESVTALVSLTRSPPTETVTVSDGVTGQTNYVRSMEETVAISDGVARLALFMRGLGPEIVAISDIVATAGQNFIRNIATEVVDIFDSVATVSPSRRRTRKVRVRTASPIGGTTSQRTAKGRASSRDADEVEA